MLNEAKLKYEQSVSNDVDAHDYENESFVDDIFSLKTMFKRNSKTKGAMREPLRTLTAKVHVTATGQANMDRYFDEVTGDRTTVVDRKAVELESYKMVGEKYYCPYCSKELTTPQGINKAYKRHLSTKACEKVRERLDALSANNSNCEEGETFADDDRGDIDDDRAAVEDDIDDVRVGSDDDCADSDDNNS